MKTLSLMLILTISTVAWCQQWDIYPTPETEVAENKMLSVDDAQLASAVVKDGCYELAKIDGMTIKVIIKNHSKKFKGTSFTLLYAGKKRNGTLTFTVPGDKENWSPYEFIYSLSMFGEASESNALMFTMGQHADNVNITAFLQPFNYDEWEMITLDGSNMKAKYKVQFNPIFSSVNNTFDRDKLVEFAFKFQGQVAQLVHVLHDHALGLLDNEHSQRQIQRILLAIVKPYAEKNGLSWLKTQLFSSDDLFGEANKSFDDAFNDDIDNGDEPTDCTEPMDDNDEGDSANYGGQSSSVIDGDGYFSDRD